MPVYFSWGVSICFKTKLADPGLKSDMPWHDVEDTRLNGIAIKATEGCFPVLNKEWVNCRYQVLVTIIVTITRSVLRGYCHPMALKGANLGQHVSTDPLKV